MTTSILASTARLLAASLLLAAGSLLAQDTKWEFGIAAGGSVYEEKSFNAPPGSAETGFENSFAAGAWFAQDLFEYISGEIRYLYGENDVKLAAGGTQITFGARTHSVHYDILVHTSGREAKVRPFFTAGFGAKGYFGTGSESAAQPLADYALLTKTSEWKPVATFGGGVKIQVSNNVQIRVELRDYFSQFPKEVILPAPGADLGGWIHNLVPTIGLGFTF